MQVCRQCSKFEQPAHFQPRRRCSANFEALGPDHADLVPFHDVLLVCMVALKNVLVGPSSQDRDWSDRQQLYCSLLFGAAERWLSYRQETGEPPVDPAHEKWWIMLIYRLTSAVQSAPQLGRPCRFAFDCHERCFETTLAWLQRGMDLDDPALSDCFSEPIFSFAVISQLLRPSETAEAAAAPAAAGPPNKAKGGAEAARTRR